MYGGPAPLYRRLSRRRPASSRRNGRGAQGPKGADQVKVGKRLRSCFGEHQRYESDLAMELPLDWRERIGPSWRDLITQGQTHLSAKALSAGSVLDCRHAREPERLTVGGLFGILAKE